MGQIDWGGRVYEPCLSVIELKAMFGIVLKGKQRNYGVNCYD